ncbi:hypothetical protein, partial [Microbispora sp. NPDC049125]|uniref:hypothetical protein n=1 Tax=Microbispora sp. NPDC049125 TaxID=3154929 RepID=UPI003465D2E9
MADSEAGPVADSEAGSVADCGAERVAEPVTSVACRGGGGWLGGWGEDRPGVPIPEGLAALP